VPHELRDSWLTDSFFKALVGYTPSRYDGTVTILRASEVTMPEFRAVTRDLGWKPYATGGVDSRDIPGDHHTITEEPNVRVLGQTLSACLEAADPAPVIARTARVATDA
jgi:thioesterase domain-containing protein